MRVRLRPTEEGTSDVVAVETWPLLGMGCRHPLLLKINDASDQGRATVCRPGAARRLHSHPHTHLSKHTTSDFGLQAFYEKLPGLDVHHLKNVKSTWTKFCWHDSKSIAHHLRCLAVSESEAVHLANMLHIRNVSIIFIKLKTFKKLLLFLILLFFRKDLYTGHNHCTVLLQSEQVDKCLLCDNVAESSDAESNEGNQFCTKRLIILQRMTIHSILHRACGHNIQFS